MPKLALDEHIALRPAESMLAVRLRRFCQLGAFGAVALSTWYYCTLLSLAKERTLNLIWLVGLSILTLGTLISLSCLFSLKRLQQKVAVEPQLYFRYRYFLYHGLNFRYLFLYRGSSNSLSNQSHVY